MSLAESGKGDDTVQVHVRLPMRVQYLADHLEQVDIVLCFLLVLQVQLLRVELWAVEQMGVEN